MTIATDRTRHAQAVEQTRARYEEIRHGGPHHLQHALDAIARMTDVEREAAAKEFAAVDDTDNEHDFHLFCVVRAHDELVKLFAAFVPFRTSTAATEGEKR